MKKILLIFIFYFLTCGNSFAYLDPGTGSIILHAIIALLAAATTIINGFWKKIKTICAKVFFSKKKIDNDKR